MLKLRDAALQLRISFPTIKRWIYNKKIRSNQTAGGHHRIPQSEVTDCFSEPVEDRTTTQRRNPAREWSLVSGLSKAAVNFTQRGSLASTGSPSNIDRQIARIEHCLDGAPVFGTKVVRNLKVADLAEAVVAIHSAVNNRDQVTLRLEARLCSNFVPAPIRVPFERSREREPCRSRSSTLPRP
jgi:excisionase family DNA binding protein